MNVGYRNRLDGEIEAWVYGKRLLFFRLYGDFQSMAELRCTPTKYGNLAILRATNDALPDAMTAVGKFVNNADEDRGFLSKNGGCFSRNGKTGGF